MVRMDRRGGTWKLLGSVVYAHRQVQKGKKQLAPIKIKLTKLLCAAGAVHDRVHWVPGPHLFFFVDVPGGEGSESGEI